VEALKLHDQRGLLDCLRELHGQCDAERFPAAVLAALDRVIPSGSAIFQEVDLRDFRASITVQRPNLLVTTWEWESHRRHMRDHPLPAHYARHPRSGACRLSDFVSRRRFHDTGLYVECYGPIGIEHQLTVPILLRPPFLRIVVLNRDRPDFSDGERRLLDLIRPHAEQAFRNAQAFTAVRHRMHDADRALTVLGCGLIVADDRGRVRMRAGTAEVLERSYFGRPRPPTRLAAPLYAWMREVLARLDGTDDAPMAPTPLVLEHGDRRLVVRLLPDATTGVHRLLLEAQCTAPSRRALDTLGLSPRETDVLQWVLLGKTNGETAAILDLSPRTVQKHLERMFEKLGVETRTAAAARAWELVGTPAVG
jgi:DNA-binding CsgD family transcriptional regulator